MNDFQHSTLFGNVAVDLIATRRGRVLKMTSSGSKLRNQSRITKEAEIIVNDSQQSI